MKQRQKQALDRLHLYSCKAWMGRENPIWTLSVSCDSSFFWWPRVSIKYSSRLSKDSFCSIKASWFSWSLKWCSLAQGRGADLSFFSYLWPHLEDILTPDSKLVVPELTEQSQPFTLGNFGDFLWVTWLFQSWGLSVARTRDSSENGRKHKL